MYQILAYIKFLFRATNHHGVHSPFVYNLLTLCIYRKDKLPAFEIITNFQKTLKKDHKLITVKDFGAGSRIFNGVNRKISAIAKNAGISENRAKILNRLISYLEIITALELGTSVGISSAAIAAGNSVKLTTLEGCPKTAQVAQQYFKQFGLDNIKLEIGEFELLLKNKFNNKTRIKIVKDKECQFSSFLPGYPPLKPKLQPVNSNIEQPGIHDKIIEGFPETIDLVYFDGNHQKQATLDYFHLLLPAAHNNTVFIFDDIHWSRGMEEAWETIKMHQQVRISIDFFYWGMVFFRREQEKEHFTLRL